MVKGDGYKHHDTQRVYESGQVLVHILSHISSLSMYLPLGPGEKSAMNNTFQQDMNAVPLSLLPELGREGAESPEPEE